jgi:galactose mutarotase-like enzyme
MKYSLRNELLQIEVLQKGAEWCRMQYLPTGVDYLWTADPQVWGKYAPLLFPIVGTLKEGKYFHNGVEYALLRHGFARDRDFELIEQTADRLVFELKSDDSTKTVYPFSFRLRVQYTLTNLSLRVHYTVMNEGQEEMYFSIGGHPAFRIPFFPNTQYEDYALHFEKPEHSGRWPISAGGLIERASIPFFEGRQEIPLTKTLFARDALVFKQLSSKQVTLLETHSKRGIRFHFGEFPYLGLWAAPGADFVCIEPWQGIADSVDHTQNLQEKEGMVRLAPGAVYGAGWTVEIIDLLQG